MEFSGCLLNGINPYFNERDVLGVWPDKLLAVHALVSRYFGFDTVNGQPKGRSNLLEMMLRQVVLASVDSDYQGEQK
ncbi:protein of unknown function [Shewanella benthica]|uniref:Uncharacterized protein n=1 Tax=Shewanella benthica TaxID=43661 RepID=A0A330M7Z5_9GAMM|nr:hypothetical protein [Shewanella benthica]SQH78461.1 protein of unknown function [Shewanella benthica]